MKLTIKLLPFISIVTLVSVSCGQKNSNQPKNMQSDLVSSDPKITNGIVVDDSIKDARRFSTVAIQNADGSRCTGVVLSNDTIGTAAHCVVDFKKQQMVNGVISYPIAEYQTSPSYVIFNISFPFSVEGKTAYEKGYAAKVTKIYAMKDAWNGIDVSSGSFKQPSSSINDLAILEIDKGAVKDFGYRVVSVYNSNTSDPIKQGDDLVIAGYGITKSGGRDYGTLRWADVKVGTSAINGVNKVMQTVGTEGVTQGGTYKLYSTTCQGDSGGPTYKKVGIVYQLVAITSFGGTCGTVNSLGISQDVTDKLYNWFTTDYASFTKE